MIGVWVCERVRLSFRRNSMPTSLETWKEKHATIGLQRRVRGDGNRGRTSLERSVLD